MAASHLGWRSCSCCDWHVKHPQCFASRLRGNATCRAFAPLVHEGVGATHKSRAGTPRGVVDQGPKHARNTAIQNGYWRKCSVRPGSALKEKNAHSTTYAGTRTMSSSPSLSLCVCLTSLPRVSPIGRSLSKVLRVLKEAVQWMLA